MGRDLRDNVIVITGASAGIGAATAIEAARAGMHAVLAARRTDKLEQTADRVREIGRRAEVVPCDVADEDQVDRLIQRTADRFGRLDVMFANAGYGFMRPVDLVDDPMHRRIFDVNYFGTVHCVRKALPLMRAAGSGHLLITSSIVARVGIPNYAPYAATKAAQDVLAMALRAELEPEGIHVTAVYPIGTKTEFFQVSAAVGGQDTISENTPQALMQSPDHVARRVVNALRRPCPEVWPARWAHFASSMATLFPRLTHAALRRHARADRDRVAQLRRDAESNNAPSP